MFENYLESIANLDSKYQLYAKYVTKHIEYSIDKGLELYATHSHCTDAHDVDINMLMRICDVHNVPLATNYKTASIMVKWFKTNK